MFRLSKELGACKRAVPFIPPMDGRFINKARFFPGFIYNKLCFTVKTKKSN